MKQDRPPISEQGIHMRLTNWGWCQNGRLSGGGAMTARETRSRSPYGGQGYKCMTLVACNAARMAAKGAAPSRTIQAQMDFDDAAKIQRAYARVHHTHQLLLKLLYVKDLSENAICRQLSIKMTSWHHWNDALRKAQEAIEDELKGGNR